MSGPSAFDRLRSLLADVAPPPGMPPIALHLGEPRFGGDRLDTAPLADVPGWTRYPPLGGTAELRAAYEAWLARRFGVRESVRDGRVAVEPTPGSKQAVASLVSLAVRAAGDREPVVVVPAPAYPTYLAATEAAGARAVTYATDAAAAVRGAGTRIAAVVVCDPGSPRGDVLPAAALADAATAAREARAVLVVDECYVDVALGREPAGFLSLVERREFEPGAYAVLHTLSKRSAAPGLRSGFVAGDPATVGAYASFNRTCGVATPEPVCAVAAALWADDTRVAALRASLARSWAVADELLGDVPGYRRPDAGFFLWLPVADDLRAARELWRDHALTVMPGRFLAGGGRDGAGYLRVALVHDEPTTREALARLRAGLTYEELTA